MSWDHDDQDKALAYISWLATERAEICQCGTKPADWVDENGHVRSPPPFSIRREMCHGCARIESERDGLDPSTHLRFVPWSASDDRH